MNDRSVTASKVLGTNFLANEGNRQRVRRVEDDAPEVGSGVGGHAVLWDEDAIAGHEKGAAFVIEGVGVAEGGPGLDGGDVFVDGGEPRQKVGEGLCAQGHVDVLQESGDVAFEVAFSQGGDIGQVAF
jgi:hypothetical protein